MQISTHMKISKATQNVQTLQEIVFAQNCYVEINIISDLYSAYVHVCVLHTCTDMVEELYCKVDAKHFWLH